MELRIVENTQEKVLLEVLFEDAMDRISNTGFTGNEKFVSVTKGTKHTMTKFDNKGNSIVSFNFGKSEYQKLLLKGASTKKVLKYIESQNISLD